MTDTKVPQSRREVWLNIALAVARDGLPEPQALSMNPDHLVCMYLDTADECRAWADWLGIEDSPRWQTKDNGTSSVWYHGDRFGWPWQISAFDLPSKTLAAQVAEAILTPDSLPDGAA